MNRIAFFTLAFTLSLNACAFFNVSETKFPFAGPMISLAPKGLVISFISKTNESGWLEICETETTCNKTTSPAGEKHLYSLKDLSPNKIYSYRVGQGDKTTKWYKFKNPNRFSNQISFLVLGDVQDSKPSKITQEIVDGILEQHSDVDIIISPGDLTAHNMTRFWTIFFDEFRELLATKPFMPAPGNHDSPWPISSPNIKTYLKYFTNDLSVINDAYYTFDFGPARFIALNSEAKKDEFKTGAEQYNFVKSTLNSSKAIWNFAYNHIGPINYGFRHTMEQGKTRETAVLYNGRLDWHFGGHEHLYQRSYPLNLLSGKPKRKQSHKTGVGYMVIPSISQKPGSHILDNEASRTAIAFPGTGEGIITGNGFTRVDIKAKKIHLRTFFLNSYYLLQLIDEISYEK
jgi:hypothetical protein